MTLYYGVDDGLIGCAAECPFALVRCQRRPGHDGAHKWENDQSGYEIPSGIYVWTDPIEMEGR